MPYHTAPQVFVLSWSSVGHLLNSSLSLVCRYYKSWGMQWGWRDMQPTWSERDPRSWRWPWWAPLPVGWWTLSLQGSMELMSWLPLLLRPCSPILGGDGLTVQWGNPQREPIALLPPWHQHPWRRMSWCCRQCFFPRTPLRPKLAPKGSCMLPLGLPKGPLDPCYIADLSLPAKAFKSINFKDSGKIYMYSKCDKTSSNWESMVSHYLLRICLVCPECGMSYSDPSNFCHHAGRCITCCFTSLFKVRKNIIKYTQQVPDRCSTLTFNF